ncbi:ribosome biosynthesis protein rrb1 [Apophysomyces sp. BC1034]|nr:ribosome biosynthesis protein rrb1 [Apophysomyces sp. BC1034]
MSKRQADQEELREQTKSTAFGTGRQRHVNDQNAMGDFEDAWEDEIEEESGDEQAMEEEENPEDADGMDVDEKEAEDEAGDLKLYLPGQPLEEGEVLEADLSTYVMLHNLEVRLPFLSFDVLRDGLGDERRNFPATAYVAAGTSVPGVRDNEVLVMKMSNLHKTQNEGV